LTENIVLKRDAGTITLKTGTISFTPPVLGILGTSGLWRTNQNASTESFLGVAEKYMTPGMDIEGNKRLDWFFAQWVYGTDVPRYKFDYTAAPEPNGSYLIKANLTQSEVSPNFAALVPIYADLDGRIGLLGRVRMIGSSSLSDLKLRVPKKPKRVLINANYDVLSRK
jgi:hypothetical protein